MKHRQPAALSTEGGRATVYVGDSLDVLRTLPDESVDTVLTSPPYWGTRDYGVENQIGLEDEPGLYVDRLVKIFAEVRRLLKMRGTVWLNIGDVFLRGPKYSENSSRRSTQGWNRNKQLALLPFRVAIALQDTGWIVRNTVVWAKPNAMPASVTDRLTNRWEPVFLLSRDEEYYFNLDRLRIPPKTSDALEVNRLRRAHLANGKAVGDQSLRRWLNSPRHRIHIEGMRAIERRRSAPKPWELASYLLEFAKKRGVSVHEVARQLGLPYERVRHYFRPDKIGSRLPPVEVWNRLKPLLRLDSTYDASMRVETGLNVIRNHPNGKNPGDIVHVPLEPFEGQHYATMPKGLARTLLLATLPPNGVCLDPFSGSGTTGLATLGLGGRFIGIDLVQEFAELSINRMKRSRTQSGRPGAIRDLFETT